MAATKDGSCSQDGVSDTRAAAPSHGAPSPRDAGSRTRGPCLSTSSGERRKRPGVGRGLRVAAQAAGSARRPRPHTARSGCQAQDTPFLLHFHFVIPGAGTAASEGTAALTSSAFRERETQASASFPSSSTVRQSCYFKPFKDAESQPHARTEADSGPGSSPRPSASRSQTQNKNRALIPGCFSS